jgi:hypothetical protein
MAGGPEDHFSDSRELYVLVEGDEWAHMEALDPDTGYWARRLAVPAERTAFWGECLLAGLSPGALAPAPGQQGASSAPRGTPARAT